MSKKSNNQGRAYEYICLHSLQDSICRIRRSQIVFNSSYYAAENAWNTLSDEEKELYKMSASSTVETIFDLEPNIVEVDEEVLSLYIQSDKHGEEADVRDIIIERKNVCWEIGLSIKHNHMAVKHSRLSKRLDFGKRWYGIKCSERYWNAVKPIFDFLEIEKAKGSYFRDLTSKEDDVYVPLLKAFMEEVKMQVDSSTDVPRKLVEYLLSKYDFYKVVGVDKRRVTIIQAFNMYGTLNQPSKTKEPTLKVPEMELPTTLLYLDFKPNTKTTVIMVFDNGWQFSFRIHNAKDTVEPSLKFDIQIVGMPAIVNVTFDCKW